MPTFKTYDTVGAKEDVSDVISMLTPHKTPFTTAIGGAETVKQKLYSWQEDELEGGKDNAQVEGFDATEEACDTTEMLQNTTQIFSRTIKLSGSLQATDHYGRANELARQIVKKGKSLRLDHERALVGVDQAMVLGSDTVARRFASASQLVHIDNKIDAAGADLSEAMVRAAIRKAFDSGSEGAETFMVKPTDAELVSEFAGTAERVRDVGAKPTQIMVKVDIYTTALGTLRVTVNREIKPDFALLFDPSMWRLTTLKGRTWFRETLAKTGDNTKIMLAGEYGLKHDNRKGAVLIQGLK
ncbi:SU10 major capsid protein [Novosphingobium panipatense]|uniref:Uncharacterized protein n=1 Tax=Novosphingobium panipatense TaxID=428991 RepID=A0ABY1Q656_9SPHN|nr:DUF5309 family protein [Novosphingobium panipatense]SMP58363.1 hypothetical protein SAMN06296065_102457 [Novosphingobium panipatense]